jgi:hypothetical protein
MTTLTPTCPICGAFSRPEPTFRLADPAKDYWRCTDCQWQHSTPKPGTSTPALDEAEPGPHWAPPAYQPSSINP